MRNKIINKIINQIIELGGLTKEQYLDYNKTELFEFCISNGMSPIKAMNLLKSRQDSDLLESIYQSILSQIKNAVSNDQSLSIFRIDLNQDQVDNLDVNKTTEFLKEKLDVDEIKINYTNILKPNPAIRATVISIEIIQ
jgi:hypothetical protein